MLLRFTAASADRRRVLLVVEPSAVAMGLAFFGPLMTQMVASMRQFDAAELATVRRFLLAMNQVVTDRSFRNT